MDRTDLKHYLESIANTELRRAAAKMLTITDTGDRNRVLLELDRAKRGIELVEEEVKKLS